MMAINGHLGESARTEQAQPRTICGGGIFLSWLWFGCPLWISLLPVNPFSPWNDINCPLSDGKGLHSCVCMKNHLRTVRWSGHLLPPFNGLCFLCWKSGSAVPAHSLRAAWELRSLCHISPQMPLARLYVPNWKAISNHGSSLLASFKAIPALPCPFCAVFRAQVHRGFTDQRKIRFPLHCCPNKSWHLTYSFGHTEHGADIFPALLVPGLSTWGKWWPKSFCADGQERNDQLQMHSCAVWGEKNQTKTKPTLE